jgi:hypothetical protein
MVGYSKRALQEKLGLRSETRGAIVDAPDDYARTLGSTPDGVEWRSRLRSGSPLDWVQCFVVSRAGLERRLPELRRAIFPDGALWISWPKKASGVRTDVTEDVVRELALAHGLVDVKVCAVDETWSGLKLVVPLRDRLPKPRRSKR